MLDYVAKESFNFTSDFEDLVLACLVAQAEKFHRYGSILSAKHFTSVVAVTVADAVLGYQAKFGYSPSWEVAGQLVQDLAKRRGMNTGDTTSYMLKLRQMPTGDIDYVCERVVHFCRERATVTAIRQSIAMIQEGKMPPDGFSKLFEDAVKIGQDMDDLGYLLHVDADRVIDKITAVGYGVRTGYPQYDAIWRTGWAPGWLIVPLAPPKRYKTSFCLNIGLNMVGPTVGEDVLYYTCEISQELAVQRMLYNISGLTEQSLFEGTEGFREQVKQRISEQVCANMVIKHFPIGTASTVELKAHAKTVIKQANLKPKAIIIDYADCLRSCDTSQPQHIQQASIYKEVIALGKELGCCIIMPDRCTADTVDKRVPNMKSFQGAFAKGGILDVAIGLCSTESEYAQNILRTFVFINRHGAAFQHFRGKVDPSRCVIDVGESIPYDPDEEQEQQSRERGGRGGRGSHVPSELADGP